MSGRAIDQLFTILAYLDLPMDHFAVAGSAALYARGLIADPRDLDVVARGPAWEAAMRLGDPVPLASVRQIRLCDGDLEIYDGWFPERWPVDEIIDGAEVIGGLRYMSLDVIVAYKSRRGRPRDREHLASIAGAEGLSRRCTAGESAACR